MSTMKSPPDYYNRDGGKLLERLLPVANDQQFEKLKAMYPVGFHPIINGLRNVDNSGSHIGVTIGSNRLRLARMHAKQNNGVINEKQLKDLGIDLRTQGHAHVFDGKGNTDVTKLSQRIDSLPKLQYKYSHGYYDGPHQRHDDHLEDEDGHPNQDVFRLHMTPGQKRQMLAEGVYHEYKDLHDKIVKSGVHPVAADDGIGWVRYTKGDDGIPHIDELQSDYSQTNGHVQGVKWDKIKKILWQGKAPTTVLHEAFHQHLRDSGQVTDHQPLKVVMFTAEAKHKNPDLSGLDPNEPLTHHHQNTYGDAPPKMGYTPVKGGYGPESAQTQNNEKYLGVPTQENYLGKSEIMNWVELNNLHKFDQQQYTQDYQHILNRFHTPVKIAMVDFSSLPEFRAAKTLAPHAQFDEDLYREALWRYDDNPVWAAIFAYGLPRTQQTVNDIEQLRRMF